MYKHNWKIIKQNQHRTVPNIRPKSGWIMTEAEPKIWPSGGSAKYSVFVEVQYTALLQGPARRSGALTRLKVTKN